MCILWGILSIREPQGSFISLISPQTGHSLAQSLSPMPSRMTDPEFVKVNQTQIPDLTMQKLKPWKVEWLAQDYTVWFWRSWDHHPSSPDPQSILFYVFKGNKVYFILSFPCIWHALLASSDLKVHFLHQLPRSRWTSRSNAAMRLGERWLSAHSS